MYSIYLIDTGTSWGWNPFAVRSPSPNVLCCVVQVLCRNDFDKKILLLLDALWERNKLQEAPGPLVGMGGFALGWSDAPGSFVFFFHIFEVV